MSFVVPVHNEVTTVAPFIAAISPVVDQAGVRAELVFVNDGSTDGTLERLFALQDGDPRVRIVNLSRNFGKEAALTAGLHESRGDVVIPIDADLQDPPQLLVPFLNRWREGYDVVFGVRRTRGGDSPMIRWTARWFYRTFNSLSPTPIPPNVGDFRLMDRRVVTSVLSMDERNRFMKGLFSWVGFPSIGVEYERPGRTGGTTSWTPWRRWNLALDGIVGFSAAPLRISTYLGLLVSVACGLYGLVILVLALSGGTSNVPGYASQILIILFLGGTQLVSLGVLGEYLARVLIETKGRPVFLVEGVYDPEPANLDPIPIPNLDLASDRRRAGQPEPEPWI